MSLSVITFAVDGGGDYIPADHHLNHPPPTVALGLNIFAWVVDGRYIQIGDNNAEKWGLVET